LNAVLAAFAKLGRDIDFFQRWFRFRIAASPLNPWRLPELDRSIFRGGRVIILGPAQTVGDDLQDIEVDRFDFVVRLNNGIALALADPATLGTRTDVLFHNLNEEGPRNAGAIPPSRLLLHKVRFCVFPHWGFKGSKKRLHQKRAQLTTYAEISLTVPPRKFCDEVRTELAGHQPTIGSSAILYFLSCDLRELHVHGFTFFETPYVAGYNDQVSTAEDARKWVAASKVHDPQREKFLIRRKIESAERRGMKVVLGRNVARFLT
jgi:hypothetical protein